jgi:hypothetical protein
MRRLLAILVFISLAWAQDFSRDDYLHSFPDQRLELFPGGKWPYLGLTRRTRLEQCRNQDPRTCRYEWWLPFSTTEATRDVARDMRRAWQRFEERYWWRVQTALNQPGFPLMFCTAGLSLGPLNPPRPAIAIEANPEHFPANFPLPLPGTLPASAGMHRLDTYWPLPQVPTADFCDGLQVELLPIMVIPPFCVRERVTGFQWCTPGFPDQPLWFNEQRAADNVRNAIQHGMQVYFPQYQADVLQALAPRIDPAAGAVFAPLPWQAHLSGTGAILAAVGEINPDPVRAGAALQSIADTLLQARLGYLERSLLLPYYGQSFRALSQIHPFGPAASRLCQVLGNCAEDLLEQALRTAGATANLTGLRAPYAPGFWRLEQLKRYFPPSHPVIQEVFGYASFFQAFNQLTLGIVPDITARWAPGEYVAAQLMRTLGYWFVPVIFEIIPQPPWIVPVPDLPRLRPVPPYFLPYVLERTHYSWISVPEGYLIPRVRGLPGGNITGFAGWDTDQLYRYLLR